MAIPMMISMMVQALYNVVDSIFVAQLSENALTAVSLAFPVQNLMISVGVGTGVGINAFLSKSLGEKDFESVNKSAANGIFLAWAGCAAFMLIGFFLSEAFFRTQTDIREIVRYGQDYMFIVCVCSFAMFNQTVLERLLMSTGKTFYAMISQTVGAMVNIALDPVLIFGLFGFPRLEVAGAAWATVAGQVLAALVAFYFNLRKNHEIHIRFKGFRPSGAIIRRIYAVGFPTILMMSVGSVMTYGLNLILISFTATATAVFGVFFRLQSFLFLPVFGITNAMVPILAYNFGARKKNRILKAIRLSVIYAVGIMVVGTSLFELYPAKLFSLFNATPAMLAIGVPAFRIMCSTFPFAGFCVVAASVFQALGSGIESLIVSVTRQLVVLLPAAWLLSLTGTLGAVWWSFPIAECVTLAMSAYFLKRAYDNKIKIIA
jgi:putative MATE family efflux protein